MIKLLGRKFKYQKNHFLIKKKKKNLCVILFLYLRNIDIRKVLHSDLNENHLKVTLNINIIELMAQFFTFDGGRKWAFM